MTNLIEMKTATLTAEALNWSVAKALGLSVYLAEPHYGSLHRVMVRYTPDGCHFEQEKRFQPSTDWAEGGPLIESKTIGIDKTNRGKCWGAWISVSCYESNDPDATGPAPLVAACRAIVASVLGETVSVPKELV